MIKPNTHSLNHFMNTLFSFLFQYPLLFVLCYGVKILTGLSVWYYAPIAFVLVLMYDFGENLRKRDS